jgi:hypothetical protein
MRREVGGIFMKGDYQVVRIDDDRADEWIPAWFVDMHFEGFTIRAVFEDSLSGSDRKSRE